MPYLVKVGYYVQENRLTSQGYYIKRNGKKVTVRWGGIYVKSNPTIKIYWKWYKLQEKVFPFSSETKAREFQKNKITYFLKRKFDQLPKGYTIRSRKEFNCE